MSLGTLMTKWNTDQLIELNGEISYITMLKKAYTWRKIFNTKSSIWNTNSCGSKALVW